MLPIKYMETNKTYQALVNKTKNNGKMPSIDSIHKLLTELGIEHYFDGETVNVVEYRSGQNTYVNSRHRGKIGKKIEFRAFVKDGKKSPFVAFGKESRSEWINLDSSSSYYSWNTHRYALDLLKVLNNYKDMTFVKR